MSMRLNTWLAAVLGTGLMLAAPAHSAEPRRLALSETEALIYTDAGFVTVEYISTAFGLTIRPVVEVSAGGDGGEPVTRALTKSDLKRACEVVLATDEARLGGHAPEYILFQITKRSLDLGLVDLKKSRDVYFRTRRGRCKPVDREPRGVK